MKAQTTPKSLASRCLASLAAALIGVGGAVWSSRPLDVTAAGMGQRDPAISQAQHALLVAHRVHVLSTLTVAVALLSLLLGLAAGTRPRRWLFRLHRMARFLAIIGATSIGFLVVVAMDPSAPLQARIVSGIFHVLLLLGFLGVIAWWIARSVSRNKGRRSATGNPIKRT